MKTNGTVSAVLISLLIGNLSCLADAVSNTVGFIRIVIGTEKTDSLANPFVRISQSGPFTDTRAAVEESATPGDMLHVWTGCAFNTYFRTGTDWLVAGTEQSAPEARLSSIDTDGCLLTRQADETMEIVFSGSVLTETTANIGLSPAGWSLFGCPYPVDLALADLVASGTGVGDKVRIWDTDSGTWLVSEYTGDGTWTGTVPVDCLIPAGRAILYYNAREQDAVLTFGSP